MKITEIERMRKARVQGDTLKVIAARHGISVNRAFTYTKGYRPQVIREGCVMKCKHCRNEIVGNVPRTTIITVDGSRAFVHVSCTVNEISSDKFGKALAAAL